MKKPARTSSPNARVPTYGTKGGDPYSINLINGTKGGDSINGINGKLENPLLSPITLAEMHELLDPLRSCLFRVERALQDLPLTVPPANQLPSLLSPTLPEQEEGMIAATKENFDDSRPSITKDPDPSPQELRPQACSVTEDLADDESKKKKQISEHLDIAKVLREEGLMEEVTVLDKIALRLEKSARWWEGLEEPDRSNCIYKLVKSSWFDNLCMLVIVFNSALVAYTADWHIQNFGEEEPVAFDIMQRACFFWFIFELIMRMSAHRIHFFINDDMKWNIFDLVLVSISLIDFAFTLIASAQEGGGSGNVAFMRVLRLLKLARIFRSLRSFRFFKSLESLLQSFQKSFTSLFWGLVMLAFVLYLFTLIFMQACIDYLHESPDDPAGALFYVGSFGKTWLSLYMSVTGGDDWGNLYDIIADMGWIYGLLLVFFTFFFLFALFNILTGVLVEKAIVTTKPERTDMILKTRKNIADDKQQFMRLCKAMDQDGDGLISWAEFERWMCNPVMLAYMASIGIEIYDVELFFNTVAAREGRHGAVVQAGEVTIEHFVEGCMHMKGSATALDMQRQLFEMHVLHHDLKHVDRTLTKKFHDLEFMIGQWCHFVSSSMEQHAASSHLEQLSVEETLSDLETARAMMHKLLTKGPSTENT